MRASVVGVSWKVQITQKYKKTAFRQWNSICLFYMFVRSNTLIWVSECVRVRNLNIRFLGVDLFCSLNPYIKKKLVPDMKVTFPMFLLFHIISHITNMFWQIGHFILDLCKSTQNRATYKRSKEIQNPQYIAFFSRTIF